MQNLKTLLLNYMSELKIIWQKYSLGGPLQKLIWKAAREEGTLPNTYTFDIDKGRLFVKQNFFIWNIHLTAKGLRDPEPSCSSCVIIYGMQVTY